MLLYLLRSVVVYGLYFIEIVMLVRAVMSFIAPTADGVVASFVYNVTEFFVSPVRELLNKIEFVRNSPIDISFLVTYLIIVVLSSLIR
ncbi:MAG: YggT family protein [Clostridia bacterium]|nr:YggT family protein [Clostridia bacterium]